MAAARDEILDLRRKSIAYRKTVLQAIHACGAGHTGGSLSCIDILNVLYNSVLRVRPDAPDDPDRDRYIQSKGHCVEALYVVLADRGFFPADSLRTMSRCGSDFIGHPTRKIPGIEHNTGALGHGLSIGVGCALAGRMDGRGYRTYVLLGDGELAEGSNWEALMAAAHFKLDNLVLIIDRNRLQISGPTEEVLTLEPLKARLEAFGAAACEVDGHDVEQLRQVLDRKSVV